MNRFLVIVLIAVCVVQNSKAQLRLSDFTEKYNAYQTVWARTKLQLILNQEKFTPGDTIFFKAYFLKEDLTRIRGKQLVETHLVNDQGKSTVHLKFHVHNGLGFNQLIIPDTLKSGIYYITAYNNWMRNFDQGLFFKKKLIIVRKNEVAEVKEKFLRVAPEGGKLIAGVSNKLAIFTHQAGSTIEIKDYSGQVVSRVTTDHNRTASLHFTPVEGNRYTAHAPEDALQVALPVVENDGVGLQLIDRSNGNLSLSLTSPATSGYRGKELYMVITARGKILYSTALKHNIQDTVKIMTTHYPEGLIKVSLLDAAGTALTTRDFYHHHEMVKVNLHPDQPIYATREKLKLEISISDIEGKPMAGEFSVRAINAGLFDSTSYTFRDQLNILSELKLPYFPDTNNEDWQQSLDHVLIVNTEALP